MSSIKDRLAALRQSRKTTAPSFIPDRRPKREEVVLPDVRDLVTDTADLSTLRELVALHVQYSAAERAAKHQKAPVAESIKSICADYKLTRAVCDRTKVSYYPTVRETISQQLLLDAGVPLATIRQCTVRTESYSIRITPPGGADDDTDD
jgi:hypothetical protein